MSGTPRSCGCPARPSWAVAAAWSWFSSPRCCSRSPSIVAALTDDAVGYDAVIGLGFTLALPLIALLAATAVLGPEVDDGSIVYLISKPVSRHVIAASKFAVAWAATVALGALPLLVSGLVLDGSDPRQAVAWGVAGVVAGTAYTALFLALAAFTRHAVVIGLLFALLWEGLLGSLLGGIRWVSIGPWGRGVAEAISPQVSGPGTGLTYAIVAASIAEPRVPVVHRRPAAVVHPARRRVAALRHASEQMAAAFSRRCALPHSRGQCIASETVALSPRRGRAPGRPGSRRRRR